MIDQIRHRRSGDTIAEWIPMNVVALEDDAVSFSEIILDGQEGFGLSGEQLDAFIAKSIRVLIENGGLPVIGGSGTQFLWLEQSKYGSAPAEVAAAVIAEWKASGGCDPGLGGLWFALPDPADPKFVKRA